ncbi:unnamed protein product [Periconia digitata]|uniref:Uncharacterized protein n=1 Tax=Periconia digitata TaxID=1303443 RepID=A0A9W4UK56_9PLEO|nr:unnamed protein product [Periconia digitata]
MQTPILLGLRTVFLLFVNLFITDCTAQSPTPTLNSISSPTASASGSQHFIHPAGGDVLTLGTTLTIRWTAITNYKYVTIQLRDNTSQGFSQDLLTPCTPFSRKYCGNIATHAPNTGSFEWVIPIPVNGTDSTGHTFPRGERVFWLKMFVEDFINAETGNKQPVLSYSQIFAFAKEGESGTTVSVDVATLMVAGGLPLETIALTDAAPGSITTQTAEATTVTAGDTAKASTSTTRKASFKSSHSVKRAVDGGLVVMASVFGIESLLSWM